MEIAPDVALSPAPSPVLAVDSLAAASRLAPDGFTLSVALAEPASRGSKPESPEETTGAVRSAPASRRSAPASRDGSPKSGGSTHADSAQQAPTRVQARHQATNERMASGNKVLGVKQACPSPILGTKRLAVAARQRHHRIE